MGIGKSAAPPWTRAWADEPGADGYGANAGMAVDRAKGLVGA